MMDGMDYGIFGFIIWLLILFGIILLIKYLLDRTGANKEGETAIEILKKRYAKGEINKEEFEEKKKDL